MADWDKVKGFFRRQTQFVNQTYRKKAEPTVDTEYENLCTIVEGLKALASRDSGRCKRLAEAIDCTCFIVHEASLDPPAQEFQWDDMQKLNTKLAHAAQALTPHAGYAKKVLMEHGQLLDRFVSDVNALATIKEERKQNLLEFDFFRHKVSELRADPPSDPQRIPRNEGRVMEFQQRYDALNTRLKQALTGLMSTGERLSAQAHQMFAVELNRYAEESGRAWKAANIVAEKSAVSSSSLPPVVPNIQAQMQGPGNTSSGNNNANFVSSPLGATSSGTDNNLNNTMGGGGGLPLDSTQNHQDNKTWNQSQSTFNFNQQAAQQQQQQQQDPLNSTTNTNNARAATPGRGGGHGRTQSAGMNNTTNNNDPIAPAPARPPPVAQPREKGSRRTEDDPFRV